MSAIAATASSARIMGDSPVIVSDSAGQKRAHVYFEETGTDTLVTRALVRRRFGIASVIAINLLLPHFHEGAGS
jgi:hypothetical protein